jgi:hypothetical protein
MVMVSKWTRKTFERSIGSTSRRRRGQRSLEQARSQRPQR